MHVALNRQIIGSIPISPYIFHRQGAGSGHSASDFAPASSYVRLSL
jgi:hypothetical protein